MTTLENIRNVAIIAHVDHGKTTLVDKLLREAGALKSAQLSEERIMDRNDLERERGITILSKCTAVTVGDVRINIIDTPGHADFGGEVERIVQMADGALLLVDAAEGPKPQTRFVLRKALAAGLKPLVIINKIDRKDARPDEVLNEVFDLFCELEANDDQLEFPVVYASARNGIARTEPDGPDQGMELVFNLILENVPAPEVEIEGPMRFQPTTLDYSEYTGRIAIGRVRSGKVRPGQNVFVLKPNGARRTGTITHLYLFDGVGKRKVDEVTAGDICEIHGLEDVAIGETITDSDQVEPLPGIHVDEPTLRMLFCVNNSPFAGREGDYVTSRKLRERLEREVRSNVALRVEFLDRQDAFLVSGRGVLHLGILIETMRREGYEFAVGKPEVVLKEENGVTLEPFEDIVVEVPEELSGKVFELLGTRRARVTQLVPRDAQTNIHARIPARGTIGLHSRLMRSTGGRAVLDSNHGGYEPMQGEIPHRNHAVLVSMATGEATGYALYALQDRGELFVGPGEPVYEGMIVGEHPKDRDIPVNPTKAKHLTNIRAAGSDENIILTPPRVFSLEECLEYIESDELVEVTPKSIRLRKLLLNENDRRKDEKRREMQTA